MKFVGYTAQQHLLPHFSQLILSAGYIKLAKLLNEVHVSVNDKFKTI